MSSRVLIVCFTLWCVLLMRPAEADNRWVPRVLPEFDVFTNSEAVDFGRAGYQSPTDGVHPWEVREKVLATPPEGDATDLIQDALTELGEAGGGKVRLGEGRWNVRPEALEFRFDNVRLEGAGRGKTIFYIEDMTRYQRVLFKLGKSDARTWVGSQSFAHSWQKMTTHQNANVEP